MNAMNSVIFELMCLDRQCGVGKYASDKRKNNTFIDYSYHILPNSEKYIPSRYEKVGECCNKPDLIWWEIFQVKKYRYVCFDCRAAIRNTHKKKFDKVLFQLKYFNTISSHGIQL
jgi:hypothetical protein